MGCCCAKEPKEDDEAKEVRTPLLGDPGSQRKTQDSSRNYHSTAEADNQSLEETSQSEHKPQRIDHIDKSFQKHEEQYGDHLDRHHQFERTFKELSEMYPAHNPDKTVQGCFIHLRYSIIGSGVEAVLVINEDDPECIQLKYREGHSPQTLLPILMSFNITSRLIKDILENGPEISKSAKDLLSKEADTKACKEIYEHKFKDLQKEVHLVDDIQQEATNSLEQLQEAIRILKSKKRLPSGAHDSGVEDIEVQCKPEVDQDKHQSQDAQDVPPIISVQEAEPKQAVSVQHDADDNKESDHSEQQGLPITEDDTHIDSANQQTPVKDEESSSGPTQDKFSVRSGEEQLEHQQKGQTVTSADLEVQQIQSDPTSTDDVTSSSFSADDYRSAESPSTEDNYKSAEEFQEELREYDTQSSPNKEPHSEPGTEANDRESLTDDSELTVHVQKEHDSSIKEDSPLDTSHGDDTLESDHDITQESDTPTETSYVGEHQEQETLPIRTPPRSDTTQDGSPFAGSGLPDKDSSAVTTEEDQTSTEVESTEKDNSSEVDPNQEKPRSNGDEALGDDGADNMEDDQDEGGDADGSSEVTSGAQKKSHKKRKSNKNGGKRPKYES